jgi:catechol-2,3-dioxygenase
VKVNHLNLAVSDVNESKAFLEKYFHLKTIKTRGNGFALLNDDNGMILTLMKGDEVQYPATFHVGFYQESREKVNEINQRLKEDGFEVKEPQIYHGAWTFYLQAPGGFTVEVLAS